MGSVYRAEPLSGGEAVALKIVNLEATADGRAARRFEREAESGTRIDSPYVARTLASGRVGERWGWLAMEFAEGVSLEELQGVGGTGLEPPAAKRLLSQLFAALSAAHREGIVHRDLKPDNVRVSGEDEALAVKVLDFGIAKDFGVSTLSGTTPGLGTPLWTAPEQGHEGYQPSPSADVWSLGLLTFFVLTGQVYWQNAHARASMADLAIELIKGELLPATERRSQLGITAPLPRGFDAWFARTVNRDPAQRFQNATDAWHALAPLLDRESIADSSPEVGQPGRAARGRERPSVIIPGFLTLVILGVITMGLAIFWLLRTMHI